MRARTRCRAGLSAPRCERGPPIRPAIELAATFGPPSSGSWTVITAPLRVDENESCRTQLPSPEWAGRVPTLVAPKPVCRPAAQLEARNSGKTQEWPLLPTWCAEKWKLPLPMEFLHYRSFVLFRQIRPPNRINFGIYYRSRSRSVSKSGGLLVSVLAVVSPPVQRR